MFNKLIVGYDGSDESGNALNKAVYFMQQNPNATLFVAYVNEDAVGSDFTYSNQPLVGTTVPQNVYSPLQFARDYSNQMIKSIQTQLDKHHITGQIVAIDGHPAQALCHLAEYEHADTIIVGNSGKSRFQKFFVGSVSEKLVKESPCSVMVVK